MTSRSHIDNSLTLNLAPSAAVSQAAGPDQVLIPLIWYIAFNENAKFVKDQINNFNCI